MKIRVILVVVVVLVLGIGGAALYLLHSEQQVKDMEIGGIDLERIPDGVYHGKCDYMVFTCSVDVTVRGHKITDIKVFENRQSKWVESAKGVTKNVIREQSLQVDTITGATITGKAILKAIENALSGKEG